MVPVKMIETHFTFSVGIPWQDESVIFAFVFTSTCAVLTKGNLDVIRLAGAEAGLFICCSA